MLFRSLASDLAAGQPATLTPGLINSVILTVLGTSDPGITLDPLTGIITLAPGLPAGNYNGWPTWGTSWFWLAGLGVFHTGLAYVILYAGMARLPAASIALLQFVYPAAALLMDWLVYGHALSALQMAGVGLMGVAMWWARSPQAVIAHPRAAS